MTMMKYLFCYLCLLIGVLPTFSQNLNLTNSNSGVIIGDLDVSGNQITVEALIYLHSMNDIAANVVSKHTSYDYSVNYLLRPQTFEITTYLSGNSGNVQFLQIRNPYTFKVNKWYHIAATYDGTWIKYYVDGCLVVQEPFSGNLYQNDINTMIGNRSDNIKDEQFYGMIDEVRIWNICKTQDQVNSEMLNLSNPTTAHGLCAYYKFDGNYNNYQGNPAWNGTPTGSISFSNSPVNIEQFSFSNVEIENSSCSKSKDATVLITSNKENCKYSLDGYNFTSTNFFTELDTGKVIIYMQSPEGCVIDTTVVIGNNNFYYKVQESKTICEGELYHGYSVAGMYTDTLISSVGCDTIRSLTLSVNKSTTSTTSVSINCGEVFIFNDHTYTLPGTYQILLTNSVGCDSLITLNIEFGEIKVSEVPVSTICADDDNFVLSYQALSNDARYLPEKYSVKFDAKAHAAGFIDFTGYFGGDLSITVPIPTKIYPDRYNVTVQLINNWGCKNFSYDLDIYYPSSIMAQKWGDVIACKNEEYNGGYQLHGFQWYKNGNLLPGETNSYVYIGPNTQFAEGDEYYVNITRPDNSTMYSCIFITKPTPQPLSVYPSLVATGGEISLNMPSTKSVKVNIWTYTGVLIDSKILNNSFNVVNAPSYPGTYILEVTEVETGMRYTFNILVQN